MLSAGKKLKFLIKGAGFTQEEAANLLGITRQTLSNYLKMAEMPEDFIQNVTTKLKLDVSALDKPATFTSITKAQKPDIHLKKNPTAEDIEKYVKDLLALRETQMEERIVNNLIDRLKK